MQISIQTSKHDDCERKAPECSYPSLSAASYGNTCNHRIPSLLMLSYNDHKLFAIVDVFSSVGAGTE